MTTAIGISLKIKDKLHVEVRQVDRQVKESFKRLYLCGLIISSGKLLTHSLWKEQIVKEKDMFQKAALNYFKMFGYNEYRLQPAEFCEYDYSLQAAHIVLDDLIQCLHNSVQVIGL